MRHDRHGLPLHALIAQGQPLTYAKTMLFIDDHQPQPGELYCLLKQRMGTDDELRCARLDLRLGGDLVLFFQAAGEPGDVQSERLEPLGDLTKMLLSEDFGRRHERCLIAAVDGLGGRQCSNNCFAAADIAL